MRIITTCITAIFLLTGCGIEAKDAYTKVRSDRSPLIEGFTSYAGRAEIEEKMQKMGLQYSIDDEGQLDPTDARPTYAVVSIKIQKFSHVGHAGELYLMFFNDRLSDTKFFPENPENYLAALRNSGLRVAETYTPEGNTLIWTYEAFDGRRYVGWSDSRLNKEHSRWIARYS